MRMTNLAVAAALLAGSGVAFCADKPGAAPAPKECPGCTTAKAACGKGGVGYCEHCGVVVAKVAEADADKAKEAATKAGGKDADYKDGVLTVHVDKKAAGDVKKALMAFCHEKK